ncbi:ABC transporter permease [Microbacterium sp. Root180]|uniref:ABC transporter permease n=1 Tax=Microbacterium sp. Root180 TaxID=1736483 RepID=UPI0006F5B5B2|nr:ABC transporter permease [Microbacterium sp. Root180]KRB36634.1 hypothetical protein ASD93_11310 [Microbacterium sp. Root180]
MDFLITCLQAATPIWLAALGGLFAQRAGVLHMGLEGLMLIGAFVSVTIAIATGSLVMSMTVAIAASLVVSVLFWLLITKLRANVVIVGLAISLTAASATTYALVRIFGSQAAIQTTVELPKPFGGELSILTYAAVGLTAVAWFVFARTRWGLRISVSGRDVFAARSAGVHVDRTRLVALLIAGACCALAGTELALSNVQSFSQNMAAGRGYVAFIAVLLGGVTPIGTAAAAIFFGFAEGIGIEAQLTWGGQVPSQFIQMAPYVATIVAMVVAGIGYRRRGMTIAASPEALE